MHFFYCFLAIAQSEVLFQEHVAAKSSEAPRNPKQQKSATTSKCEDKKSDLDKKGQTDSNSLLSSDENRRPQNGSYRTSSLHYDTQLFINNHKIGLSSPITVESLEREDLLYGAEEKPKLGILADLEAQPSSKTEPISKPKTTSKPKPVKKSKPFSSVTKEEIKKLTDIDDDLAQLKYPSIPWFPRSFYYYYPYYPLRKYYFDYFADATDFEWRAFQLELDMIKRRNYGYYVSPLRLTRYYETLRQAQLDKYRPLSPPTVSPKSSPEPSPRITKTVIKPPPRPKSPDPLNATVEVPRYRPIARKPLVFRLEN